MKRFICVFVAWMLSKFEDFSVGSVCRKKSETTFVATALVPTEYKGVNAMVQISVKITEKTISMALVDSNEVKSAYINIDPKSPNVFQMLSLGFDALVAHYVFNYNKSLPY